MPPLVLVLVASPWRDTRPRLGLTFPLSFSSQELQNLEHSNSAIQKDIDSLTSEVHYYTLLLERHKPFCCLKDAVAERAAGSPAAVTQASASPPTPGLPPPASFDPSPHIHSSSRPSSSAAVAAFPSSSELHTSTSALSDSFPHSLFPGDSPRLSAPEGAAPPSAPPGGDSALSPLDPAALGEHPGPALFSTPASKGTFLMNHGSASALLSCAHSAARSTGPVSAPLDAPQLPTVPLKHSQPAEQVFQSSLASCHLWPSGPLYPAALAADPEQAASAASSGGGGGQNTPPESESLLSLLTDPPPLSLHPADFIGFPQSFAQSFMSPLDDISTDLSLAELLNSDQWILE